MRRDYLLWEVCKIGRRCRGKSTGISKGWNAHIRYSWLWLKEMPGPDRLESDFAGMGDKLMIREEEVQQVFESTNARKTSGLDNIGGRVLKHCSPQLSGIYHLLFQLSLDTQVARHWGKCQLSFPKDYRPISLVIGMLLLLLCMHLDGSTTHARVLFAEFLSAFNTIHALILADRLKERFGLACNLIKWILNVLTGRSQRVKVGKTVSEVCISSMAPHRAPPPD